MSLDLDVKITKKIKINNMLNKCREEIKKLVNYDKIPDLELVKLKNGSKILLEENHILKPTELLIIKFKGMKEEINVAVIEIPFAPYITKEEAGIWAGISVQGNEMVKFLLASGVALYLSDYCGSAITDERQFWCGKRVCTYDFFFHSLKIDTVFLNGDQKSLSLNYLVQKHYEKMNKGNLI